MFADFEDSNTTGRVTTIQNDTSSGKAVTPNLHIENNHFVIGTLPLVLGSLTYDDLVITGNTFSAPGAAISSTATVNDNYVVKDNINSNVFSNVVTTANLQDVSHIVNISDDKVEGSMVFDTTADIPMYATGAADASTWVGEKAGSTITLSPV